MTDEEILELLAGPESDRLERKRSLRNKDQILKSICAFANDLPGYGKPGLVVVGLEDNGDCADLSIDDALLQQMAGLRTDGTLLPFPVLTVKQFVVGGCEVGIVLVEPADAPPVRLRGRTYVRVGPTTRQATPQEEHRLAERRRSKDLPFDLQPVSSASLEDLDLELFRRAYLPAALPGDILAENQRTELQQLESLRFVDPEDSCPTVLGLLTVGRDPRRFIPCSYLQFLRLDGEELLDPIKDQKEIDGPIPELLARLDETLKIHISTEGDIRGGDREIKTPDYPLVALQQLTRNAILHRTYSNTHAPVRMTWFSDRIEILSPGGPYGQVTPESFGNPGLTDYRNPHLAEVMKNLGYVQRFGMGISLARRELESNGNPPPEFEATPSHVLVTIKRRA